MVEEQSQPTQNVSQAQVATDTQTEKVIPVKSREPRVNFFETQAIISKLEKEFDSKVICFYTPKGMSINQGHPDIFLEQLREIGPQEKLHLVVVSDGGDSSASYRIATILREYTKNLSVVVPSRCASAATVLSLSADEIIMCPSGYLTAIDTKLNHELNPKGPDNRPVYVSVDQIKRVLRFLNEEGPAITENSKEGSYRTLFKYIHPVAIGEIDRISSRTILVATKMMKMHAQSFKDEAQINWIANHLYNDYPEHGFPIMFDEAKEIGLPVKKANLELGNLLRNLVNYYDSTTREETTHSSGSFFHKIAYTNMVESSGSRTVFRTDYDRRLNSITKVWQTENDRSQWINISFSASDPQKMSIRPLDLSANPDSKNSPDPATG